MTKTSAGRRQQHQQHRARRRGDLIAQPHRVDAGSRRSPDTPRDARLTIAPWTARSSARAASSVDAGREPAEQLRHPVHAAVHHRRRQMVRAGDDVGDDLGFRRDTAPTARARRRSSPCDRRAGSVLPITDRIAVRASSSRSDSVSTAAPAAFGPVVGRRRAAGRAPAAAPSPRSTSRRRRRRGPRAARRGRPS